MRIRMDEVQIPKKQKKYKEYTYMKKSNHMINCQIDFRTDEPERTFYVY